MRVTASDVAAACGVSRGTVDRALKDRPGISRETRKLILQTAEKMGYKPDFLGQSLVTGRTMSIGVVVFDVYARFFGQLVTGIETAARELGYFANLALTHKDGETERQCLTRLVERKCDGILLFSCNRGPAFDAFLFNLKTPIVSMMNRINDSLDYIGIDEKQASADAVRFLRRHRHENIAYVSAQTSRGANYNMDAVERRLAGFASACRELGLPCDGEIITGKDYVRKALGRLGETNAPTALLCSNDIYALELMKALKDGGRRVPGDISVMGFDNIDVLGFIEPRLATVGFPIEELGRRAANMLIARLEEDAASPPVLELLPHEIIAGGSVADI